MAKRGAGNQLTHDNWEEEEEAEEAGHFKIASSDVLKKRQIKTPKRRVQTNPQSENGGVFKGFAGFGATAAPAKTGAPSFNFGSTSSTSSTGSTVPTAAKTGAPGFNFGSTASDTGSTVPTAAKSGAPSFNFGSTFSTSTAASSVPTLSSKASTAPTLTFGSTSSKNGTSATNSSSSSVPTVSSSSKDRSSYLRELKNLNQSVAQWIKDNVDNNAYCILTPIFKDYKKHLEEIEKKYDKSVTEKGNDSATPPEAKKNRGSSIATSGGFPTMASKSSSSDSDPPAKSLFSFGKKDDATSTKTTPFAFGKPSSEGSKKLAASTFGSLGAEKPVASTFGGVGTGSPVASTFGGVGTGNPVASTFGGVGALKPGASTFGGLGAGKPVASTFGGLGAGKPFSFGSTTAQPATKTDQQAAPATGEDAEYVPPKAEVAEVKEEGSTYTKRCKLFYQKAGQWVEKGVGNLHLKPTDSGKTQLVIRADTNLGNILLNIIVSASMPVKRQGKNNVTLSCIPNPPVDPKADTTGPTPMLMRVKSGEDADELAEKLNAAKQ